MEFFEENSNVNLNVNYSRKKFHLRYLTGVENVPLQLDTTQLLKLYGRFPLTASKNEILLRFRSDNCLRISRPFKHISNDLCGVALKNTSSATVLQIIIRGSFAEFIFINVPCFQHVLLNTFRRMRLKYENHSLRRILF